MNEIAKKPWIKRLFCRHKYKFITMWAVEECEKCGEQRINGP